MNIRQTAMLIACAALLCGCGGNSEKVDGGYFGEVPSLLVSQAEDKAEIQHKFKTEMKTEDDIVKLQSEANRKEEEYETKLRKAYEGLKDISVRYIVDNADYEMDSPPLMEVRRFSSESALATIKFTLKAKGDVQTELLNELTKQYSLTVYCKFVDKDGNFVRKESWYTSGKIDGQTLGATISTGTPLSCEVSFGLNADKKETDGKTTFNVPEAAIDQMVIITKDEYESLK